MVGGDATALAQVTDILNRYCGRVIYAGPSGRGLMLKLINQHLVAAHCVAAAEAAALVLHASIDPTAAHNALTGGWAASRMLELQLSRALAGELADDGAGLAKFADILPLVGGFIGGSPVRSELFPVIESVFRTTIADGHSDESLAALVTHYTEKVSA